MGPWACVAYGGGEGGVQGLGGETGGKETAGSRSGFSVHFSLPLFTPLFMVILFISTCSIKYIFIEIGYRNNFVIYLCTPCIYWLV